MQITDPIADLLTRIRNASTAKHPSVRQHCQTPFCGDPGF